MRGEVIPGSIARANPRAASPSMGSARCLVFGRIAGRHAAQRNS